MLKNKNRAEPQKSDTTIAVNLVFTKEKKKILNEKKILNKIKSHI